MENTEAQQGCARIAERIESVILRCLLFDEDFSRKTLPFIQEEYFEDKSERAIFQTTKEFVEKYNALPTPEAVNIMLGEVKGLAQDDFQNARLSLDHFAGQKDEQRPNQEWLITEVERFCQDRAVANAVLAAMAIVIGEDKEHDKGAIPEILSKALAVSFDPHIGHDYFGDSDARFDYYHRKEQKLPFDLEWMNKVTNGGIPSKTLNVVLGGTHVGKTLIMCHCAATYLKQGKNVLYVTLEIAEEEITKRIDANLLDIAMDDLNKDDKNPKKYFQDKINNLRTKTNGRLIVKQYPTAAAHSGHFRHLLNELRLKKNFKPDILIIDYLNICLSSRIKQGPNVNSYTYVKAIGEELRGLGVEFDIPVFTGTQTNRAGFNSSDVGMEDTSESFGLPMTADFMFAAVSTPDLEKLNQYLFKILKCRYAHSQNKKFIVGVDYAKMRLYDVEQNAQMDGGAETEEPDSDGPAGTLNGPSCGAPVPRAKTEKKDDRSLWGAKFEEKRDKQRENYKNFKNKLKV